MELVEVHRSSMSLAEPVEISQSRSGLVEAGPLAADLVVFVRRAMLVIVRPPCGRDSKKRMFSRFVIRGKPSFFGSLPNARLSSEPSRI